MNDIEEYYKEKELLSNMESSLKSKNIYYCNNDYENFTITINLQNWVKEVYPEKAKKIFMIVRDKIHNGTEGMDAFILKNLADKIEEIRLKIIKDFKLQEENK